MLHPCCSPSNSTTSPKRQRGFPRWRFGLLSALFSCVALGCAGKQPAPPENPPPAPVALVFPQELRFGEWTELLGATQPLPNHAARISAAVEGRVLWLLRDPVAKNGETLAEGQRVDKGQIIGQLEDHMARAKRNAVEAMRAETEEQKEQADLAAQVAQIDLTNVESLLRSPVNGTQIRLANQIQLDKARLALKTAESKQKEVVAKLKGIEDEVKALKEQLDFYKLRAPIAGRLGPIQAVPGQTLAIGATVAEVVDLDAIDVLCLVPPYTAARLALEQPTRVAAEKGNAPSDGKIVFIAVQAQPDTGSFAVKARFPNPDLRLRGGSVLRIEALTQPEQPRVTIPESALLEDQDPPSVVIAEEKTEKNTETGEDEKVLKARRLRAKIGIRNREWHVVELLELEDPKKKEQVPIDGQTQFVTKGGHGLEDGDKVKQEVDED